MYNYLARNVFFPTLDFLRGTKVYQCLKELEKSQWLGHDRIKEIQNEGLARLIRHAYDHIPYYHMLFKARHLKPEQIRDVEDLKKLPITTKQTIINNLNDLRATNISGRKIQLYTTGGSTGEPTRFWISKRDRSWGTAAMIRANCWCNGYNIGDPMALVWASPIDLSESKKLEKKIMNLFMRRYILNAYQLSEESMSSFARKLVALKPKVIRGYASAVHLFACFVEHEQLKIKPNAVITTADMLLRHQRKKIEDVFECDVYDSYGSREVEEIASECSEHSGYHIAAENLILEFVKNGEQVSSGETGEILITDLRDFTMPFIRYKIGDLGKPSNELCSCGRGLPLMKAVHGRITDIIVTPNRNFLSVFDTPLCDMPHVRQYQIIQEKHDEMLIKLVKGPDYTDEDTEQIINTMKLYLGNDVNFCIDFVSFIPNTKSGKRKFVISKVSIKFAP